MPFCETCGEHYFERGILGTTTHHRCPPVWEAAILTDPNEPGKFDTIMKVRAKTDAAAAEKAMEEAMSNWAWECYAEGDPFHAFVRKPEETEWRQFEVRGETVIEWRSCEVNKKCPSPS